MTTHGAFEMSVNGHNLWHGTLSLFTTATNTEHGTLLPRQDASGMQRKVTPQFTTEEVKRISTDGAIGR